MYEAKGRFSFEGSFQLNSWKICCFYFSLKFKLRSENDINTLLERVPITSKKRRIVNCC